MNMLSYMQGRELSLIETFSKVYGIPCMNHYSEPYQRLYAAMHPASRGLPNQILGWWDGMWDGLPRTYTTTLALVRDAGV